MSDKLEEIFRLIPLYTVGLVGIKQAEDQMHDVEHCGAGAFVTIGGIDGILTAGHVVQKLEKYPIWGFISFEGNGDYSPVRSFPRDHCRPLVLGEIFDDDHQAPDIAFIRLPYDVVEWVKANRMFFNVTKRYEDFINGEERGPFKHHVIAGVIGKESREVERVADMTTVTTTMIITPVDVIRGGYIDGYLYLLLDLQHSASAPRPTTYGGISGGPVWALSESADFNGRIIMGVAFLQTPADSEGHRFIVAHGANGIYEKLFFAMKRTFEDFVWPPVSDEKARELLGDEYPEIDGIEPKDFH